MNDDISKRLTEPFQFKRPASGLWSWRERIHIPCSLKVKNEFTRVARENCMSQAELGSALVGLALGSPWFLEVAVMEHRQGGEQ